MTDTSKTTTDYYLLCLYTHNSLVSPFLSHASLFPSYRDRRVRLTGMRGSWRVAASPPTCNSASHSLALRRCFPRRECTIDDGHRLPQRIEET